MGPDQKPPRKMMDMGPRRSMDMGRRPARPSNPPVADPAPVPSPRPVRPAPRPIAEPAPQSRQHAPQPRPAAHQPRPASSEPQETAPATVKSSGGWRTFVQVLIGLVVIAAVASAIVVLYVRYYQ